MPNDQADFAPEVRNSAWWSGDSRKAANGRAVDAILQKQGKLPIEDLSHIEAVQMGHVMQPVIGRLFQDKHQMEIKDADYSLTHPNMIGFAVILTLLVRMEKPLLRQKITIWVFVASLMLIGIVSLPAILHNWCMKPLYTMFITYSLPCCSGVKNL